MNNFKKGLAVIISTVMLLCLFMPMASIQSEAAVKVKKPAKVTNLQITRTAKNTIKLTWDKVSGAKGYEVYMSTNNSSFKKKATITGNKGSYKVTKLATGKKYAFKIRAYKLSGKKKVYGNYSNGSKINMKPYGYWIDMIEPYANYKSYEYYRGLNTIKMGGVQYSNAFAMIKDWIGWDSNGGTLTYNLENKYSKMEFVLGAVDGQEDSDSSIIQVYADNELIKTYKRKKNDLPRSYTLKVKGVYKLEFVRSADVTIGFGDVKLYYK